MGDTKSQEPLKENETGMLYEIKIQGHLDGYWSEWLGGLEIAQTTDGYSILTGFVLDQAALHGILVQIRDLGVPLISLNLVNPDGASKDCYEKST